MPVQLVIANLAGGMSFEDVADEYGIDQEDIRAALALAAQTLGEEEIRAVS